MTYIQLCHAHALDLLLHKKRLRGVIYLVGRKECRLCIKQLKRLKKAGFKLK